MPSNRSRSSRRTSAVYLRRRLAVGGGLLGVVVVVIAIVAALGSSGARPRHDRSRPQAASLASHLCPLTDLPAPGGHVPDRPALAIKIGNEPEGARPQSGLNEADIVYDTPAEGFIMRYVAVYQCHEASSVGPTRSVRWVDWHILQAFGEPILAFAGGINPDVSVVDHLGWLKPVNLLTAPPDVWTRITTRQPPDNLYTSTAALWKLYPDDRTPPPPVFQYSSAPPPGARPAASLAIDFSPGTDVVWKWDAAAHDWLHTYSGVTDVDALTSQPVTTTNIVVQVVHYSYGPYPESPGSTGDVESQTVGSGSGYVLRGGEEVPVTWHRPSLNSLTTFTNAAGKPVKLAPGRTWVEIVLDTIASTPGAVRITP
ncbi:MAG TPA: DUF3048 domain-containing protein [Acidimicrobiales bacterium]|nr:DUF3048 domain-containing protein [Acidimicrobiales bacterium]